MEVGIIAAVLLVPHANIIAANGHTTHLWMRDAEQAADVARLRENRRYLPGIFLATGVNPTADLTA